MPDIILKIRRVNVAIDKVMNRNYIYPLLQRRVTKVWVNPVAVNDLNRS